MRLFTYKKFPYPQNLLSTVFDRPITENEIPRDWEATLNYLFETLGNTRRADAIQRLYKDKLTLTKISSIYGISKARVAQIIESAIHDFRHSDKSWIMLHGLEGSQYMFEHRLGHWGTNPNNCESKDSIDLSHDVFLLDLSTRTTTALRWTGVTTIGQLLQLTESDLRKIRNIGQFAVEEIKSRLSEYGLSLQDEKV